MDFQPALSRGGVFGGSAKKSVMAGIITAAISTLSGAIATVSANRGKTSKQIKAEENIAALLAHYRYKKECHHSYLLLAWFAVAAAPAVHFAFDPTATARTLAPFVNVEKTAANDTQPEVVRNTPQSAEPVIIPAAFVASEASENFVSLATVTLSVVSVGMSKGQVLEMLGEPSIKSDLSWYYLNRGWVRFRGGAVVSVNAK